MRQLTILILAVLALSSCKVFKSNLMLKTPRDFNYDRLIDSVGNQDYKLSPNDAVIYRVFTNDGFKLIDLASTSNNFRNDVEVIVESDGQVKMPLIGRIPVEGLSIIEAEKLMEEKYAEFYVKPYVSLKVTNKRVIVFPGNTGLAKVVTLTNNNTTLIEALAIAGGIPEDGKAYKAKLIRKNPNPANKPLVYLVDLSRIENIKMANAKAQAGDVIYVEPRYRPLRTLTNELSPIITLITIILVVYQFTLFR
ncbi:MAG TPA: polysaccharide biosynthesis/export family protein [Bacteroidia bacterium]|nr:polysaccharide biosynthesis/export family protein [Bacteroidia bacterium]